MSFQARQHFLCIMMLAALLAGCASPPLPATPTPALAATAVANTIPAASPIPATATPVTAPSATSLPLEPATATPAGCQPARAIGLTHGELQDLAFAPDGSWLAAASSAGVYRHNAANLSYQQPILQGEPFYSVAISPDSKILAAGGLSQVALVDTVTGGELRRLGREFGGKTLRLAFTPDGNWLAALGEGYNSGALSLWNLADGSQQERVFSTYGNITSLAFSPDGASLALGTDTGRVEVFDWESAARLAILAEPQQDQFFTTITDLDFSPDGSFLAATGESTQGLVRVWSLGQSKRVVERYQTGYPSPRPYVAFSADGARLLGGMGDLALAWERSSGEQVGTVWGYSSYIMDLQVSPDGQLAAWATARGLAFVYPLTGGAGSLALAEPGGYYAMNVTFISPEEIAVGLYNYGEITPERLQEKVRVWNAITGEPIQSYPNAGVSAFNSLNQTSEARNTIALADTWGKLRLADRATGAGLCLPGCECDPAAGFVLPESCFWQLPYDLSPMQMGYSPDGNFLAISGVANIWHAALVWDMTSGQETAWFPGGHAPAFAPDGRLAAIPVDEINADHTVVTPTLVIYDLDGNSIVKRSLLPASGRAAFSPDGKWLAVGVSSLEMNNPSGQNPPDAQRNGLMLWDAAAWEMALYLPIAYGIVALDYAGPAAGPPILAAATETGRILVWNEGICR